MQKSFENCSKVCCQLLSMIGMIWHEIMSNGFCMWHDDGMTGSMTVGCHATVRLTLSFTGFLIFSIKGGGKPPIMKIMRLPVKLSVSLVLSI